ncbi:hypothetical protein [Lacinutrix sp. Bg11-31]|uniref:hypothetical protein n=1 Tax=Lacinutrix sp. Bg11-31 TaxID=2057808 RepID=UPI000C318F6E|nr:hypothetical protein [Lacinutrix sp. Bg11-31]AUC82016.1 hypothetical protein CW733_07710 [Lacinutrix sp. Bg11-31]
MKKAISILTILVSALAFAQTAPDSLSVSPQLQQNAAQRILSGNINSGVTVGGYGEITYNQPESKNGELDVQRLVLLFGYKFSDKVQFVTEVELEHVEEVFVEQAFVQYKLGENINARGGLMLIPMGITNEYHEPTTFNGVERPSVDGSIVPTTWREIGVGVQGRFNEISLGYQAYVFNGFQSVNGTKVLGGSNGLRNGRQKGIKSTVDSPNLSAKVDYYGLPGLRLGLAGYFGRTQAEDDVEKIDGSSIGISMVGLDARYAYRRITARGQFIHASLTDTEDYNTLNSADLGSALQGWYLEGAYNLLPLAKEQQLFAFARYSDYDTHASVAGGLAKNESYNRDEWTFGLSFKMAPGAVLKGDYQLKGNALDNSDTVGQLNVGLGVWF